VIDAFPFSICEEEGYRRALDCDALFSCVDRPWARSVLNFIAYAHLIPVVDGGILVRRRPSGLMRSADWKAHVAAPSRRCLECADQYAPGFVSVDRDGYLDDPKYIESLPDDSPLKASENVFAFSLGAASLQLLQLLSMVVGPSGVYDFGGQAFHMTTGTIGRDTAQCRRSCPYSALVGLGDRAGSPGTGHHAAAAASRKGMPTRPRRRSRKA
jgi:hypothetical protein